MSFDPHPLRWVELGLPKPDAPDQQFVLRTDGPFALRHFYRAPGSEHEYHLHLDRRTEAGGLTGCLHCGHPELYSRKRFPKAVGITIVVLAALLAPFTNYISLAVAALLDFVLYHRSESELVCYSCGATHYGFRDEPRHPRFDRTIEERLKFGERAVMGSPMRQGGTAGAPDPEH